MNSNVNRNYKDSVFSLLFSDPEILRELYSAIEGIVVPKDAIVNINTLSEALFMKKVNDLSFTIDDRIIVLIEHQSTLSHNIPLRILMYIARVYEKIIENKDIYQRKLVKIPTPEFIVLYNGKEECPEYQEMRLSSAFMDITGLKLKESKELPLELVVQIYNINQGQNQKILERSNYLNDYSFFVHKFNEYRQNLSLEEAAKAVVKYCIEHNVLKEFLEKHGSEVSNMLFDDITIEELADIRYKEGHEIGHELGFSEGSEGRDKFIIELIDRGLSASEIKQRLTQTLT